MQNYRGPAWMMVFCSLIPLSDALSRYLRQSGVHVTQALSLEYGLIALALLLFVKKPSLEQLISAPHKKWLIIRSLSFVTAALTWIGVIKFVPLPQLFSIGFLAPIFASTLSTFILKETLNKHKILSLIVGLIGTLVIIRPGLSETSPYLLLAILAPISWAFYTISNKKLSDNYSPFTLLLVVSLATWIITTPFAAYFWTALSLKLWVIILIITLIGLTVHTSIVIAYKHAPITVLAPLEFSTLIFATIYSSFLFKETIDILTLTGAMLIIGSNLYVTLKSR